MKVGKTILNVLGATMRGELLLRLRVDRLLIYIVYFFVVACLTIFVYLRIDSTMVRMEKNKETLEVLQIEHAQKTLELARFNRMSTVEEMLRESGSDVAMPQKPARRIKK